MPAPRPAIAGCSQIRSSARCDGGAFCPGSSRARSSCRSKPGTGAMVRLEHGDGDVMIPDMESRTELGLMARAVDVFKQNADRLKAMLKAESTTREIGEVISTARQGDLTVARAGRPTRSRYSQGHQANRFNGSGNTHDSSRVRRSGAPYLRSRSEEASAAVGKVPTAPVPQNTSLSQGRAGMNDPPRAEKRVRQHKAAATRPATPRVVRRGVPRWKRLSGSSRDRPSKPQVNQITGDRPDAIEPTSWRSCRDRGGARRRTRKGLLVVGTGGTASSPRRSAGQNARQIALDLVEQARQGQ